MENLPFRLLRHLLNQIRSFIMSNQTLRNALMDVSNTSEFSALHEHEIMLSDQTRVNTYQRAISKHIKPGDTVVDLGTGSGILSFFAAACKPKKRNRPEFNIRFEKVKSRSFQPDEKLDVILHEQIGDELFEENMIENIMDLKERVLKKGGRILSGKFELYLEPFSLKPEFRVPYLWENKFCDIDFSILKNNRLLEKFKSPAYRSKYAEPFSIDFYLCKPKPS